MTNAERQAKLRAARAEAGLVQLNLVIPAGAVADFQLAAELIRANPHLIVARLADTRTGRLRSLKKVQ